GTLPAQSECDFALALDEIESREMGADRVREPVCIDHLVTDTGGLQNLQVPSRQKLARFGDVAGVAAELHAIFGGPEGGSTDAFPGRRERQWQRPEIDPCPNGAAEPAAHIAEVALLATIDVLADPAGKHQPVDAIEVTDRVSQVEVLDRG